MSPKTCGILGGWHLFDPFLLIFNSPTGWSSPTPAWASPTSAPRYQTPPATSGAANTLSESKKTLWLCLNTRNITLGYLGKANTCQKQTRNHQPFAKTRNSRRTSYRSWAPSVSWEKNSRNSLGAPFAWNQRNPPSAKPQSRLTQCFASKAPPVPSSQETNSRKKKTTKHTRKNRYFSWVKSLFSLPKPWF